MRARHWALVALIALGLRLPLAAGTVSGRVFLDSNGNGRLDAGEPGLAGCVVSDERTPARTDAESRYRLELPAGPAVVFVVNAPNTWPSDRWWVRLADGAADCAADFALRPEEQTEPLLFIHGTDIHLHPRTARLYEQYVAQVNALPLPVRFVVHTGDLVLDALPLQPSEAEALYEVYERISAGLRMPLRNIIGNHEHVALSRSDADTAHPDYGRGMYRRRLGPASYAFRYGRYHFVALAGTTIDPAASSGYRDRLDAESAAWAARYLATLNQGEPVILLVHQQLRDGPPEQQLLQALQGKRLILTLSGHTHSREAGQWGGAPAMLGGAVSYAWHGFQPPPPDPRGYVLYRVDNDQVERVFLDWAARRAIDLSEPAWKNTLSGRQAIRGTVSDFDGSVRRVTCRLEDRKADARLSRPGHLAQQFEAELDLSGLADGVYELHVEVSDGAGQFEHVRPVIVCSGNSQPFEAAGPATLRLRVLDARQPGGEVLVNGQRVGSISASARQTQELSFELPRSRLRRLNAVTLRTPGEQGVAVANLRIELDGQTRHDVRFAPMERRRLVAPQGDNRASATYYIDLRYRGPRGSYSLLGSPWSTPTNERPENAGKTQGNRSFAIQGTIRRSEHPHN